MGEKQNQPFQLSFNPFLKVDFAPLISPGSGVPGIVLDSQVETEHTRPVSSKRGPFRQYSERQIVRRGV